MKCERCNQETNRTQTIVETEEKLWTGGFPGDIVIYRHPDRESWCFDCIQDHGAEIASQTLTRLNKQRKA